MPRTAEARFQHYAVSFRTDIYNTPQYEEYFVIRMVCRQLDWQIDGAAQICILARFGVKALTLESDFYESIMPTEWRNGEIDNATWHELLRSFVGVKELYIQVCCALSEDLSRSLEMNGVGLDRRLLPRLQALSYRLEIGHVNDMFSSFVEARRVAGRPVSLSMLPMYALLLTFPSLSSRFHSSFRLCALLVRNRRVFSPVLNIFNVHGFYFLAVAQRWRFLRRRRVQRGRFFPLTVVNEFESRALTVANL